MVKITDTMMPKLSDSWAKLLKEEWTSNSHKQAYPGQVLGLDTPWAQRASICQRHWTDGTPPGATCANRSAARSHFLADLLRNQISESWTPKSNPTGRALVNLNFSSWNICKGKDLGIRLRKIFLVYSSNTRASVLQELWSFLPHHCCWIVSAAILP